MAVHITQQQMDNLIEARDVMWPSIREGNVSDRLLEWQRVYPGEANFTPVRTFEEVDCGTVACFGGWCALWPAFQAQGVKMNDEGAPVFNGEHGTCAAYPLFGDTNLFEPQMSSDHLSAYDRVAVRLNDAIKRSVVA